MKLAIFDIDRTLTVGATSEQRFFRYLLARGKIGPLQLAAYLTAMIAWLPLYGRHILQKNKAYLTGLAQRDVQQLAVDWVTQEFDAACYWPCVERLREHQRSGDRVWLLSGTPDFIAAAIAGHLGVHVAIGSSLAIKRGHFAFAPLRRHPFGPSKLHISRAFANALGLGCEDVVAYGDSADDAALLRWVGTPVAVCPAERLATIARSEGWDLLDA